MRLAVIILIAAALIALGVGGVMAWWMIQSDWYDKGMMDD